MSPDHDPAGGQPPFPSLARADIGRVVEQTVLFFLPGKPGESFTQRVVGREERVLAMEHGGIRAVGVVEAIELAGPEREFHTPQEPGWASVSNPG